MLTVLGGLAEFERELIVTRTGGGRARAVARGQHMGRPPMLTAPQRTEALRALGDGAATQADLERGFIVSPRTITRLARTSAGYGKRVQVSVSLGGQRKQKHNKNN